MSCSVTAVLHQRTRNIDQQYATLTCLYCLLVPAQLLRQQVVVQPLAVVHAVRKFPGSFCAPVLLPLLADLI
jgi:hypothetical protein